MTGNDRELNDGLGCVGGMPLLVKAESWVERDPVGSGVKEVVPVEGGCEGEFMG